MEKKKTATERFFGQNGLFAQHYTKEDDQGEEDAGKPESRSTNAFLESLKSQPEEQQ
jgi:hypothetical protein